MPPPAGRTRILHRERNANPIEFIQSSPVPGLIEEYQNAVKKAYIERSIIEPELRHVPAIQWVLGRHDNHKPG